nr:MAG TPA: Insect kinin peptide [Caudoviricetes sp.]
MSCYGSLFSSWGGCRFRRLPSLHKEGGGAA